jgi:hypothetical protein
MPNGVYKIDDGSSHSNFALGRLIQITQLPHIIHGSELKSHIQTTSQP